MSSIIAASVVDLPEPVLPVTRISPWFRASCTRTDSVSNHQVSNLFKRRNAVGRLHPDQSYLVEELKHLGLWTEDTRNAIKLADGSVQGLAELPETLRAIYRTAWELPMRALIDLAADRGAFIDQSQSLNLFMANPNIGQLSSMYMYAWKRGLKTTYYLRSRPGHVDRQDDRCTQSHARAEAVACSWRIREVVRGLPVGALLDAGFDLTLRPMRYPRFYEMYRAAIKNTWTVEEIDFQIDLGHLRQRLTPPRRHLIERLVAFFATGDSIVVEQPRDQPLPAHQRARSAHVPVAAAL